MCLQIILSYIILISVILCSKVTFVPNESFNLPRNFINGKLPCSKQTVVFPDMVINSVRIQSGVSVSGFILPEDGELILEDGNIELGPSDDTNCTSDTKSYYLETSLSSWNKPDIWSSPKFNKATPDAERIPCYDDTVVFPSNTTFTLFLPDKTQRIRGLIMNGQNYDDVKFKSYIKTQAAESQHFIFNSHHDTGIKVAYDFCISLKSGCPCQKEILKIDCSVKFCNVPSCVEPIQPIGHCCKICGGVIAFDVDQTFDLLSFKELVETVVDSYGEDDLEYHLGRIGHKIQLVVVDKGDYTGMSAEVVNTIDYRMEKRFAPLTQYSGSPISKSGYGGKIFVSMFFLVVIVLGIIYLYYYRMPQFRIPVIARSDPRMFTRFNRRTESVVSLARRDSVAPTGPSSSTAFRNPLYDSIKSRARSMESVTEN